MCVSVLFHLYRQVPLHVKKIAGKTMPLERHGAHKAELFLKDFRLPLPILVSCYCVYIYMCVCGVCGVCVVCGVYSMCILCYGYE